MKKRNALIIAMILVIIFLWRRRSMSKYGAQAMSGGMLSGFSINDGPGSTQENSNYPYNSKNHFSLNSDLAENYSQ
jgi:hypothetical protein